MSSPFRLIESSADDRASVVVPTLTAGSLFSGIGGIDRGLELAGITVIWQSEIDPYACRVLARHWPHVPNLGDITTIDWSTVERPDLLCGGFPCQPVSSLGGKKGKADDRWLWPYFADAIRHLAPRYVVVENTAGLRYRTGGLGIVLGDLAALGYDAEWESLPASAVGAPHIRERVWIVAYPECRGQQEPGLPHAERQGESGPAGSGGGVLGGPPAVEGDWPAEPDVGRVADGVPARVDRLRVLGNAVVPQAAEWIGRRIVEAAT